MQRRRRLVPQLLGTGGDTLNYGSRISAPMERGVSAVLVDDRDRTSGMTYTLHHKVN